MYVFRKQHCFETSHVSPVHRAGIVLFTFNVFPFTLEQSELNTLRGRSPSASVRPLHSQRREVLLLGGRKVQFGSRPRRAAGFTIAVECLFRRGCATMAAISPDSYYPILLAESQQIENHASAMAGRGNSRDIPGSRGSVMAGCSDEMEIVILGIGVDVFREGSAACLISDLISKFRWRCLQPVVKFNIFFMPVIRNILKKYL